MVLNLTRDLLDATFLRNVSAVTLTVFIYSHVNGNCITEHKQANN